MSAFDGAVEDYYDSDSIEDDMKMLRASTMHNYDVNIPSVADVWEHCMYPSVVQAWEFLSVIFAWNIAFRLLSQTGELISKNILMFSINTLHIVIILSVKRARERRL